MTYKQFEKQLSTWRKNDKEKYNDIIMLADSHGILTKSDKISKAKKNKDKFDRFISHYKKDFGSYTSYIKDLRFRRKRVIKRMTDEEIDSETISDFVGKTLKDFEKNMNKYNDILNDLYETIMPSKDAHSYHMYAETLPTFSQAIEYLQSLL